MSTLPQPDPTFNSPGLGSFLRPPGSDFMQAYGHLGQSHSNMASLPAGSRVTSGGQVMGTFNGIPTTTPLGAFQTTTGPQVPPHLLSALGHDINSMQSAADAQFGRNQGQIDAMSNWLGGMSGQILGGSAGIAGQLRNYAGGLMGMGQQQLGDMTNIAQQISDRTDAGVGGLNKNLDKTRGMIQGSVGDVDKGTALAKQGLDQYKSDIAAFQVQGQQDALKMAQGMKYRAAQQAKVAQNPVGPDGMPRDPNQINIDMEGIQRSLQNETDANISAFQGQFNQQMMGLKTNLAQLTQSVGGMYMQGASIKQAAAGQMSQVDQLQLGGEQLRLQGSMSAAGLVAQAHEGLRQLAGLGSNLVSQAASIGSAALLQTAQLELQGRSTLAQMVQQNPNSVVSWFQGLMALYGAQAAGAGGGGGGGGGGTTTSGQSQGMQPYNPQSSGMGMSTRGGQNPFSAGQVNTRPARK